MSKKGIYLITQGYPEDLIQFLEENGVSKQLTWFAQRMNKSGIWPNLATKDSVRLMNAFIESLDSNPYATYEEALAATVEHYKRVARMKANTLCTFEDGHFIINLEDADCWPEGTEMANCVTGKGSQIRNGHIAILALKKPNGRTIVHFQIDKYGRLSQVYEKANTPISPESLKYIRTFFKHHSKDFHYDDEVLLQYQYETIIDINSMQFNVNLPTVTRTRVRDGEKVITVDTYERLFGYGFHIGGAHVNSKDRVDHIEALRATKEKFNEAIDKMIDLVENTEGKDWLLSDEIKERIYGENNFYLKDKNVDFHSDEGLKKAALEPHGEIRGFANNNRFNEAMAVDMPNEPMEMEAPRDYAVNEMVGEVEVEEVRYEEVRFEEMPTKSFEAPGQDAEIDVRSYGESMGERIG